MPFQTLENFYLLWQYFGEAETASYYNLFLATAFNRRDFGMSTHPNFIRTPSYYSWWSQVTFNMLSLSHNHRSCSIDSVVIITYIDLLWTGSDIPDRC